MSDNLFKDIFCLDKFEDVVGEDQYGFGRERRTRDASGMLRISEQTLDIDDYLCACLADRQKASDRVKWTELMQMLRKLVSNGAKGHCSTHCTWIKVLK